MISETHGAEYRAHCETILAVLAAAQVPTFPSPDAPYPGSTHVAALPALKALKVTRRGMARFRRSLALSTSLPEGDHVPHSYCHNERGEAWLVLPLDFLLPLLHQSRHAVGQAFAAWNSTVDAALLAHGWYDPATQHTPPPGMELDAIEIQSDMRDHYRAIWGRSWEETWGTRQDARTTDG